ncbi:UNVERIFIED_CONTAM: dockerin type I repeat protein [Acetivibrio alkalicellulosi]
MRMGVKRIIVILIVVAFFNTVCLNAAESMLEDRTIEDIVENYQKNTFPLSRITSVDYEIEPSAQAPHVAGKVKSEHLEEALNCVNFTRYLVGLPDDIVLNDNYNNYAQHGAVILVALGNILTHHPEKPDDMCEDFYKIAYRGTSSSNLSIGYSNIRRSVMACMDDSDDRNIQNLGHRRWLLNPDMQQIGFGHYRSRSSTYVFDRSRRPQFRYDYISWPARNYMPIEYFGRNMAWSVTPEYRYLFSKKDIEVTLTRRNDNKVWIFKDDEDTIEENGFFNVDTNNYGQRNCIIFRPKLDRNYNKDDIFDVNITGMYTYDNSKRIDAEINYTVEFFSLNDAVADKSKEIIYGDLNNDGQIDSTDIVIMRRYILEILNDIPNIDAADLNGDGEIDSIDYTLLKRYILGIINKFPVE